MEQFFPYILPQASSFAGSIDAVYWVITAVCVAYALGVGFFLTLFITRYKQGSKVNRVLPAHEGIALELIWTVIPLIMALGIFVYSTIVYFQTVRAPRDATEIFVVGKQWMWKIQHPNGRWEMNEIHLPVGKPVKLTMISEDVIHDFGIPAFRLNMDVVPGRYTQMWFNPTRVGRYHIFCAQYCGTNHAIMGGYVTVMEPGDFEKWMQTGNVSASLASQGETLFREQGCTGCHGPMSNVRAPSLAGIYDKEIAVQVPGDRPWSADLPAQTIKADYRYLHDAIIVPAKEVAAGYKPIMPSYQGRLTEEQVLQLVDYIKTLSTSNGTSNGAATGYQPYPGQQTGGNAIGQFGAGDASSGRLREGSATGDLSNQVDREAIFRRPFQTSGAGDASSGRLGVGNATGDMSNQVDRDNIFNGGGAVSNTATIDRSAGGTQGKAYSGRGGLSVYSTDAYEQSSAKAFTGGLGSAPIKGGRNADSAYAGKIGGSGNAGTSLGSNQASLSGGGATAR